MAIGSSGTGLSGQSNESLQSSPIPLKGKYVDQNKRVKVTTPPAKFPVTLAELKSQLHIELLFTDDDTYLTGLIEVATAQVEAYLRRKLITQSITMGLDRWPFQGFPIWEGSIELPRSALTGQSQVKLWFPPLQSVTEIRITQEDNTVVSYDASNYLVDTGTLDDYGRVILEPDADIVSNIRRALSVEIEYVCGYGDDEADVPFGIRQGILMYAAWLYEHRGDCNPSGVGYARGSTPLDLSGAAGQLQMYRIERLQS